MEKLAEHDIEKVIAAHEEVIGDLLKLTLRPTKSVLQKAARNAWNCKATEAEMFASRMVVAVTFCRAKEAQSTSGKKLQSSVAKLVQLLRKMGPCSQAPRSKLVVSLMKQQKPKRVGVLPIVGASPTTFPSSGSTASSSSSASSEMQALRALYGMPEAEGKARWTAEPLEVLSSQETIKDSQEVNHPPRSKRVFQAGSTQGLKGKLEWFSSKDLCMVRLKANGTDEKSSMAPGPDGFALATFPNEPPVATECPNLLIEKVGTMKRPAAAKVLLAAGVEGSSDEDAGKAREQPAEEEASGGAEVKKVTKKILYSRTYHREGSKAKSEGCTDAEAKARAQGAALKAVQEAEAEGRFM